MIIWKPIPFLAAALITAPLFSQAGTTVVVDATGATGTFESISAAASSGITSGAVIEVQGLVGSNGEPIAYSNTNPLNPTGGTESFPILLPHGVALRPVDSTPVYIWPTGGLVPSSIIEIVGSSPDTTLIGRINILGGAIGVDVSSSSSSMDVLLRDVVLGRSVVNFSSVATGSAELEVELRNCRIVDTEPPSDPLFPPLPPPTLPATSVGLRFNSEQTSSGIPTVSATVDSLVATGAFANVSGALMRNTINDLAASTIDTLSRLIEVYAEGETIQTPLGELTSVTLILEGGILEGGATATSAGWDIGIYSALDNLASGDIPNYRAATLVSATGTTISGFVEAGIYGSADLETRGQIDLRGKTEIFDTGSLETHASGDYAHSGVHLYNLEGYMGLTAINTTIRDNTGNGIAMRSSGTVRRDSPIDMGMPLGLWRCQIHGNGGDGIELESGVGTPDQPLFVQDGIVGGTHTRDFGYTILKVGSMGDTIPSGQGVINRCAISNNGEHGIRAFSGDGGEAIVYCRISNSIIWNNPLGGFVGDFSSPLISPSASGGTILTPLLHCTLYGNGGSAAPYNAEFLPVGGGGIYRWDNVIAPLFSTATELDNSVFQAPNAGVNDFGPRLTVDSTSTSLGVWAGLSQVGIGGVRHNVVPGMTPYTVSTESPVSFAGPISLTSRLPQQFFLGSGSGNPSIVNMTPTYVNVVAGELGTDYEGTSRPGVSTGLNDKGADEW